MTETKSIEETTDRKSLRFIERKQFGVMGVLILSSLIAIIISVFELIELSEATYKLMKVYGFSAQTIFYADMIWFTYAVRFNKKSVTILLKRWKTQYTFRFKDLETVELVNDELVVFCSNQGTKKIDLSTIVIEDQEKLVEFLKDRMS